MYCTHVQYEGIPLPESIKDTVCRLQSRLCDVKSTVCAWPERIWAPVVHTRQSGMRTCIQNLSENWASFRCCARVVPVTKPSVLCSCCSYRLTRTCSKWKLRVHHTVPDEWACCACAGRGGRACVSVGSPWTVSVMLGSLNCGIPFLKHNWVNNVRRRKKASWEAVSRCALGG